MPETRDQRIDTLRGLAIVLIVAAHAVMAFRGIAFQPQTLFGGTHFVLPLSAESVAIDLAYALALPVFGFVTGVTLHYTRRRGGALLLARAKSLLVPYLAWLALGTALVAVRSGVVAAPANVWNGIVTAGGRGSLWFLYALFVCVCVFLLCRSDRALMVTALLAPLVMTALAWERVDVLELRDAAWLYAPMVAGYLAAKYRPRRLALPAAAIVAVTLPLVAQVAPWPLPFASLPPLTGQLLYSVTRVACGVAGCLLGYAALPALAPLAWAGRRTLGIYAIHPLAIAFLRGQGVQSVWLAAFVALVFAAGVTLAIEQLPGIRGLALGQWGRQRARATQPAPAEA